MFAQNAAVEWLPAQPRKVEKSFWAARTFQNAATLLVKKRNMIQDNTY
jgi:hypothetical protein